MVFLSIPRVRLIAACDWPDIEQGDDLLIALQSTLSAQLGLRGRVIDSRGNVRAEIAANRGVAIQRQGLRPEAKPVAWLRSSRTRSIVAERFKMRWKRSAICCDCGAPSTAPSA